jgi:hypothetical protein
MEYIILLLVVVSIVVSYATYNLLNKLEKYEDFIEKETIRNQALLEALREIDSREMFEKDDEVGSIFYQIKETIEKYKEFNQSN